MAQEEGKAHKGTGKKARSLNLVPGMLKKRGLYYASLTEVNADIIMVLLVPMAEILSRVVYEGSGGDT